MKWPCIHWWSEPIKERIHDGKYCWVQYSQKCHKCGKVSNWPGPTSLYDHGNGRLVPPQGGSGTR